MPAGAEKGVQGSTAPADAATERRKQSVTKAPPEEEPRSRRRISRFRRHATNLVWALLAAAVPWAWFLVRDLGSVTQLIALAIPVLVVAAFLGMAISLLDERRLSTLDAPTAMTLEYPAGRLTSGASKFPLAATRIVPCACA